ncbi:uncharacterized protein At3g49055 isoform X2 [Spinacia oleracea]|uniref:Uncharacterized protein At3g49055 isoform X2 n=1 Tax=Spinacia oleracea TaxID=3562 RepID=A0ABM3RFB8_SPIOL|nr:uncharacterized protein At3g49055 isoform X2 [Spinacia oleracea]
MIILYLPPLTPQIKTIMDTQEHQIIKDQNTPMNLETFAVIEALSIERDYLKTEILAVEEKIRERENELLRRINDVLREKECLEVEIDKGLREKQVLLKVIEFIKESLMRVSECLDDNNECNETEKVSNFEEKLEELMLEKLEFVFRMVKRVEEKVNSHLKKVSKEKRELECSVMSLIEENRDVNVLFRVAVVEKEAMEKSVAGKLKKNNEQSRTALLQFAERGLQRVGFGFIVGGGSSNVEDEDRKENGDQSSESSESESEEEEVVSTVEKMMKGLRVEITQLRNDLEESRSETEQLLSLTEKQAQQITEQGDYIKEMEDRERILTQNVEELVAEIKATEREVQRWRKACELEVDAGKHVAREHDKLVNILKQELEKTRTTLQVSNKKLKLKDEVVAAAMAAQSAAEKSLQLADSRTAGLRQRIEELTRQLEEEDENRQKNNNRRRRMRRICWPWLALNSANSTNNNTRVLDLDIRRRVRPEMQTFLH